MSHKKNNKHCFRCNNRLCNSLGQISSLWNGCKFINVENMTLYHTFHNTQTKILTFTDRSTTLNMYNILHDSGYQAIGYNGNCTTVTLPRPFIL